MSEVTGLDGPAIVVLGTLGDVFEQIRYFVVKRIIEVR